MVFTIHRYIFRDLLKTFLSATAVLSVVLSLGVMLKPLRQFGIDPIRVPELLLYTLPITLTLVIPVAALLAATLNYGRLAVDNEINACRASGISIWTLIYPALVLAFLVGITTILLAFHVIPYYAARFEGLAKNDAKRTIFRFIEKGSMGGLMANYLIHADKVNYDQQVLSKVVVVGRNKGEIDKVFTAGQVWVELDTNPEQNQIKLRMLDASVVDNVTGMSSRIGDHQLAIPIPSIFQDKVKFKNLADLKAIQEDIGRFRPLREKMLELRQHLIEEMFYAWCDQTLTRQGWLELYDNRMHRFRCYAERCVIRGRDGKAVKLHSAFLTPAASKSVRVDEYSTTANAVPDRRFRAENAVLSLSFSGDTPTVVLTMKQAAKTFAQDPREIYHARYDLTNLSLPNAEFQRKIAQVEVNAVRQSSLDFFVKGEPTPGLVALFNQFKAKCQQLLTEIKIELHSRLAFGVSCVVLVLLGAGLGILFKSSHLLTAFGVSFIPAALCLITIFTGKHIAEQTGGSLMVGIAFLWGGIVVVAGANVFVYRWLLKQ